jgi:arylsulfatase A-like enzyme
MTFHRLLHRSTACGFVRVCAVSIVVLAATTSRAADKPLNVLFIIADDLRPDLGCYGHPDVRSPNLDRLAASGLALERAYVQVALCNPSRTSFLTGLRPDATRVYGNGGHFRETKPEAVTLPQFFKSHGYQTRSLGKVFHPGCDDEASWTATSYEPKAPRYGPDGLRMAEERVRLLSQTQKKLNKKDTLGPPWEAANATDEQLTDGDTAEAAIRALGELKDGPFFLAVGFLNPHLPFVSPKHYWELYPRDGIHLAANPFLPKDLPTCAIHDWSELRAYLGMPAKGPLTDEQARDAIRGYRAATSYMDSQVGRLLDELDRLHLRDSTVVVFLGDHGWQLGEHAHWCKHTNFDIALRAPLIVSAPGKKAGGKATGLVEFVDIYPTVVELCGLPPAGAVDGLSFAPLFDKPEQMWKRAAFSQYERKVEGLGMAMGRSVRTSRYRYTEWRVPDTDFIARELYDHETDDEENVNVAGRPDRAATVEELSGLLRAK